MTQVAGKSMPAALIRSAQEHLHHVCANLWPVLRTPRVNRSLKGNVVRKDLRLYLIEGPDYSSALCSSFTLSVGTFVFK